ISLSVVMAGVVAADPILNFEGFADSTILSNQYSGATFSNAIILTAGISLDEIEFPPHSGVNVAVDNGGSMSIDFATPVLNFGGFFTYSKPLTLQAFNARRSLVDSVTSPFSNNEGISGDLGSASNEFLEVSSSGGISRVTITADPAGFSFAI